MLTTSFFVAVFLTSSWVTYIATYIHSRLSGLAMLDLGLTDMALYGVIVFFPIFIIWTVWGYFYQFLQSRDWAKQSQLMLKQAKSNQEYLEVMAKLLLQMGQKSHDDFVVGKIDLFISEMNETIFDVLQKNNLMTPENLSKVWNMVEKGNRWGFAKSLINLKNQDRRLENTLAKAAKDNLVLKASIQEFGARYNRLVELLKKHDANEIFLEVIQTGAFARVHSIFESVIAILANNADEVELNNDIFIDSNLPDDENILETLLNEPEDEPKVFFDPQTIAISIKEETVELIETPVPTKDEEGGFFAKMGKEPIKQQLKTEPKRKTLNIKISDIFKRKVEPEEPTWQEQNGNRMDPLTLALERSFGKLADKSQNISDDTEPTNDKFAFLSTENTLKDLQKQWDELKASKLEADKNEADKK